MPVLTVLLAKPQPPALRFLLPEKLERTPSPFVLIYLTGGSVADEGTMYSHFGHCL